MNNFEKLLRNNSLAGRLIFLLIVLFYSYVCYKLYYNKTPLFINESYDNIITTVIFFFTIYFCYLSINILKERKKE